MTCKNQNETELKHFALRNEVISNDYEGLSLCEKYCAGQKRCWGCLIRCNSTCQWIAVTECKKETTLATSTDITVSQKPSI